MSRPQAQPQPPQAQQPQQPMPSPDKASPMAGLGSVEDRVSAYRGNPAPLQQRYAMSQDLLDLLALQKLKSEKEAAARQMQLSMGQQAAAQGGEPPTIAQQREKEVMDMTKNELAQQRGATANQQVSEQQQAMQRMMSGIAGAPGANAAAQPKMMAAGGIVGFQAGGRPEDEEQTSPAGRFARQVAAPFMPGDEERNRLREQIKAKYVGRAGLGGLFKSQSDEQRAQAKQIMDRLDSMSTEEMKAVLAQPSGTPTPPVAPTGAGAGRGMVNPPMADPNVPMTPPQAGMGGTPPPPPPPPPPAPPPPAPAPQAGLAGLPGAQGAQGAPMEFGTPTDPLAVAGRKASMDAINRDSTQAGLTEEQRVEGRLAFPEEQERRRKMIDEQRQIDEKEFDPERQRREALKRFLIGGGGRAYGELGAGAQASMGYGDAQEKAKAMRRKALEDMEQGIFSLKKGAVEGGIGAGTEARKQAEEGKRAGLGAAGTFYNVDSGARMREREIASQERQKALDRKLEEAKIQVAKDRNLIDQSTLGYTRLEAVKEKYYRLIQGVEKDVNKLYEARRQPLEQQLGMQSDPKKRKAAEQQLQDLQTTIDAEVAKKTKDFYSIIDAAESQQLGTGGKGTGTGGGFKILSETPTK
jgi:hypothetical protein